MGATGGWLEGVKRFGKMESCRLVIVRLVSKTEAVMKVAPAKKSEACFKERFDVHEEAACDCCFGGEAEGGDGVCGWSLVMLDVAGRWRNAIEVLIYAR